jgi:hypothetical protein
MLLQLLETNRRQHERATAFLCLERLQEYQRRDMVTCSGSLFHANVPTKAKPETNHDWQLVAKRGRDGRDGKPGRDGQDAR